MGARILIIEDTPHNMDLMRYLLEARGHSIDEATTGKVGAEKALEGKPDLIILDLQLPDIDGYEVLRRVRADRSLTAVSVIAVTAFAMVGDRDRVLASGFSGYITKPIEPQTFGKEVEMFFEGGLRGEAAGARAQTENGGGATIVLVDNTAANVHLAKSVLEPFGYRVIDASGVAEGLELIRKEKPDLILSDIHMPGADGFALLDQVSSDPEISNIPFVFLSSTASYEDLARSRRTSASGFVARPIEPKALIARIESILAKKNNPGRNQAPD